MCLLGDRHDTWPFILELLLFPMWEFVPLRQLPLVTWPGRLWLQPVDELAARLYAHGFGNSPVSQPASGLC